MVKQVVCISCFNYVQTRMKRVVEVFESADCEVTYVTSNFDHFTKKTFKTELRNTIQINVRPYKKNLSLGRIFSHLEFSKSVYKYLCKLTPDIVFVQVPPNSVLKAVKKYCKNRKCVVIGDCYDMWPESFPNVKNSAIFKVPFSIWRNFRDKNIDCLYKLICVSNEMETKFKKRFTCLSTEVVVPEIALDKEIIFKSQIDEKITICYLGNINNLFDIDLNVKFLAEIAKRKNVELHIIGAGENNAGFSSKVEKYGVTIVQHGVVMDFNEKIKIYENCDFGLLLYKEEAQVTMPLKCVEYLCVGLPILSNGFGQIKQLIAQYHAGFNITRDNLIDIATIVSEASVKEINNMRSNCYSAYNENFGLDKLKKIITDSLAEKN